MDHHDSNRNLRFTHAGDAVDQLARCLHDDPDLSLLLAQEEVRVRVTDGMRRARQLRGLNQAQLAELMGISQGRVSRLESVHQDRRLDSLVAHLHAMGAELVMAIKLGENLIPVVQPEGAQIALEIDRRRLPIEDSATGPNAETPSNAEQKEAVA